MIHRDDVLVAELVHMFRELSSEYATVTKMTACYNITIGLFRLFSVSGDKDYVEGLAKSFGKGILKEVKQMYKDD